MSEGRASDPTQGARQSGAIPQKATLLLSCASGVLQFARARPIPGLEDFLLMTDAPFSRRRRQERFGIRYPDGRVVTGFKDISPKAWDLGEVPSLEKKHGMEALRAVGYRVFWWTRRTSRGNFSAQWYSRLSAVLYHTERQTFEGPFYLPTLHDVGGRFLLSTFLNRFLTVFGFDPALGLWTRLTRYRSTADFYPPLRLYANASMGVVVALDEKFAYEYTARTSDFETWKWEDFHGHRVELTGEGFLKLPKALARKFDLTEEQAILPPWTPPKRGAK